MHIFISHSSQNAEIAEAVCGLLEKEGKKCFLAPRDIRPGKEYAEEIINGIDNSETMLLLMSEAANQSPHVLREVERAVSKKIPILVYKLEEVELSKSMEYFLMTHQWVNARSENDYADVLDFFEEKGKDSKCRKEGAKKRNWLWLIALAVLFIAGAVIFWVIQSEKSTGDFSEESAGIRVGDTLEFGTYNDEAIRWRVLKLSEDGNEAVLISEKILTIKSYDVAEGGTFNSDGVHDYWYPDSEADSNQELQIQVRGNSDWSVSNIRIWLNSHAEVVQYADRAPAATATSELKNGYQNEPGFLYGFTEEELAAIRDTEIITKGNALAENNEVLTIDKVYLLSRDELQWFEDAGIRMLAVPTQAAIEQDDSNWYQMYSLDYGVEEYVWWLREPVEGTSSKCYLVGNGYLENDICMENVGLEGFGIRPAITVDAQADIFKK